MFGDLSVWDILSPRKALHGIVETDILEDAKALLWIIQMFVGSAATFDVKSHLTRTQKCVSADNAAPRDFTVLQLSRAEYQITFPTHK